jgi:hypothetical protein
MTPPRCTCGRFLTAARPVTAYDTEAYGGGPYLAEVRGDCSRCGPDVVAAHGWWMAWDAWFADPDVAAAVEAS